MNQQVPQSQSDEHICIKDHQTKPSSNKEEPVESFRAPSSLKALGHDQGLSHIDENKSSPSNPNQNEEAVSNSSSVRVLTARSRKEVTKDHKAEDEEEKDMARQVPNQSQNSSRNHSKVLSINDLVMHSDIDQNNVPDEFANSPDRPISRMLANGGHNLGRDDNKDIGGVTSQTGDMNNIPIALTLNNNILNQPPISHEPQRTLSNNTAQLNQGISTTLGPTRNGQPNLESWLDFDTIQAQEELQIGAVVNHDVDLRYQRKLLTFALYFLLYTLVFLVTKKVLGFQVVACVCGAFCAIAAASIGTKVNKDDFYRSRRRWKIVATLDWVFLLQFCLCLALRIQGKWISNLTFSTIPGFLSIFLYLTVAEPPPSMRNKIIIMRGIIWIQLLLISLKLDGHSSFSWKVAFILIWAGLIIVLLAKFVCLIMFTALICAYIRHRRMPGLLSMGWQLFGMTVYILSLTIFSIITVLAITFVKYMDGNKDMREPLQGAALAGAVYSLLLWFLTLFCRKNIKEFLKQEFFSRTNYRPHHGRRIIKFKSQKLLSSMLYVMISPTYFTTFDKSLILHEKEQLLKLRTYVYSVKQRLSTNLSKSLQAKKVSLEALKEAIKPRNKVKKEQVHSSSLLVEKIGYELNPLLQGQYSPGKKKQGLSMNDVELVKVKDFEDARQAIYKIEKEEEGAENLCFICCVREANSVFMECGHGGICFECAKETWTKKTACMTCRTRIGEIVSLKPVKGTNYMMGVSTTTKFYEIMRANPENAENRR